MKSWRLKLGGSEFKMMRLNDSAPVSCVCDAPQATFDYLMPKLADALMYRPDVENFIVVHLNARKKPIGFEVAITGSLDTMYVHAREVFRSAIVMNAAGIILVHNHPSGDPTPSQADITTTRELVRAGQLLKIEVVDHLIFGRSTPEQPKAYASLRELGYFWN
jgi:DNA repair protein RadC